MPQVHPLDLGSLILRGGKRGGGKVKLKKAYPSLVSPWLHDLHSFVLRVLTDGLNGAL